MPWLRTDDGFPEHPKSDALAAHFGDDWQSLNLAFAAWHHMGCDCAARRTDGVFNTARAYRVMRAPREAVDRALAGLLKVGLLERRADCLVFHDWSDYQPTRAQIDAEREAKTARQQRWRDGRGSKDVDAKETDARRDVDASTRPSVDASRDGSVDAAPSPPVPSRPLPTQDISSPAAVAPSALPAQATVAALALDLGAAKPARAKRAKPPTAPMPFSVADALDALASTAGRRFVVGDRATWAGGWVIALGKLVRQFPDLGDWSLVGAWLAAGFGGGLPTAAFGVRWAASGALPDAVAKARAWDADGRPAALDGRGFPARPTVEAPDPWAAAMRKAGVR